MSDALCLDRFWNIYEPEMDKSKQQDLVFEFTFCDPNKLREQIKCSLFLGIKSAYEPIETKQSSVFNDPHLLKFPELFEWIIKHERFTTGSLKHYVQVSSISVGHIICPSTKTTLLDLYNESPNENIDGSLALSGPICKQFGPTLSRCMPRVFLDIPFNR
jgi:hypothetical protein